MRIHASILFLTTLLALTGCGSSRPSEVLPSGCYYDAHAGIPVLKVQGTQARILIQSQVPKIDLAWTSEHKVIVRPAILLIEGPKGYRIERNDALPELGLPIVSTNPMTIGIPDAPDGYMDVKLGRPCKA